MGKVAVACLPAELDAPFKHDTKRRCGAEGCTAAAAGGRNESELTDGGATASPIECSTLRQPKRGGGGGDGGRAAGQQRHVAEER